MSAGLGDWSGRWLTGALALLILAGTGIIGLAALLHLAFATGEGSAQALQALGALPGMTRSLITTLAVALVSTGIAVAIAIILPVGPVLSSLLQRLAPFLLAIPHLSMAVAIAFLVSPSGWIVRLFSPWLTGLERPPTGLGGESEAVLALIFGLVIKEIPFLVIVATSQLRQIDQKGLLRVGACLGYGRHEAWLKLVLPQLYPRLRPAIIAILVFAAANVEMALPLGPSNPPMWSVMTLDLMKDAEPTRARAGALAAIVLVALVLFTILCGWCIERVVAAIARGWSLRGAGARSVALMRGFASLSIIGLLATTLAGFASLVLWSLAGPWRFPDALPRTFALERWLERMGDLVWPAFTTLWLALVTTILALSLAIFWLEYRPSHKVPVWLYLPLLVPQIAMLAGLNYLFLLAGVEVSVSGVIVAHLVFVLPYVVMVLSDGFWSLDPRFARSARSLGHGRLAVLWRIKLPLLRPSLMAAAAIGFSVSVALYLPTIFAGGGRVSTLATELVALSHGGDRRSMAAAGLILALLPLTALVLANRLGQPLRGGQG